MNFEAILDQVQSQLHDDGTVWTRAELLRWGNDAYRELLAATGCTVRPYQIDLPGRVAWSASHQWEDRHAQGTIYFWTKTMRSGLPLQASFQWEVEAIESITPTNSLDALTQPWERVYSDDTEARFQFALPHSSNRPLKVYWDDKRLAHTSTREMDLAEIDWWREQGEPLAWLPGIGRERTFEVFEVLTTYVQGWDLRGDHGIPRHFTSDANRTYGVNSAHTLWDWGYTHTGDVEGGAPLPGLGLRITVASLGSGAFGTFSWEADTTEDDDASDSDGASTAWWEQEDTSLGLGAVRRVLSEDRQYLACAYDSGQDLMGSARRFATGDDALTVWHTITPTRQLTETDVPDLIPSQLQKYLKFFILSKAFGRIGEGFKPDLAQHFAALYKLGESLLAMLGTPSVVDRVYAREQTRDASVQAPPRVRFPSNFQRDY